MDLSTVRREFPAEILHRINNSYTVRVSPPVIRLGDFCVAGCREVWYNRWSGIIGICGGKLCIYQSENGESMINLL